MWKHTHTHTHKKANDILMQTNEIHEKSSAIIFTGRTLEQTQQQKNRGRKKNNI